MQIECIEHGQTRLIGRQHQSPADRRAGMSAAQTLGGDWGLSRTLLTHHTKPINYPHYRQHNQTWQTTPYLFRPFQMHKKHQSIVRAPYCCPIFTAMKVTIIF